MIKNKGVSPTKDNGYEMVNVDMEELNVNKLSPLLEAARKGDLKALILCLEKGESILQTDSAKGTALHSVAYNENFEVALECSEALILHAQRSSNSNELRNFLNIEDISKRTALGTAAIRGNAKLMKTLLDYGAKVNINSANETIFHTLAKLQNHENALSCAQVLFNLKYHENRTENLENYLNIEDKFTKRTALHMAGISGNHNLIRELIQQGSDATKVDYVNSNIFHYAVGNAFEEKAVKCMEVLLDENLISGWGKSYPNLLETLDISGRCPVHIAARRGFHLILRLLEDNYMLIEANTGYTPLHSAASLGDEDQAMLCVKEILSHVDGMNRSELCNSQDSEGCTPLYLSAKERNVEACKLLLLAGSGFDIKNKRGKTPLEKVYEKIPQAVSVLLDEAIKNSGYIAYFRTINTYAELDFGPILGYSTSKSNIYKETEELVKVCKAKFGDRKAILYHPFVKIYVYEKWEKVKWIFRIFRMLHILWFILNCAFVVYTYRSVCPIPGAKNFTWTGLRPLEEDENMRPNKTLSECEIPSGLQICGYINLITLFVYAICQFHETKQKFHQVFRPPKSKPKHNLVVKILEGILYYISLVFIILPCGPILIGTAIFITILPTIGVQPFSDFLHYFVAGMVGLGVWAAVCLEFMKIPKFSFYKNLLWKSAKTLLVAICVTAPILLGFAALFAILIPAEPAFSSPAQSFVKVTTFMIGELDYGSLVYGETQSLFLGWVMLFMALFIIIIVVLLVNFLIGLAAEEINNVWDRAEIWRLCTKLEEIHALESFLDEQIPFFGHGFLRNNLMLMPPNKEDDQSLKQKRKARIKITNLPNELQKEFHLLRLKTVLEIK